MGEKYACVAVFGVNLVPLIATVVVFTVVAPLVGLRIAVAVTVTVAFLTFVAQHVGRLKTLLLSVVYASLLAVTALVSDEQLTTFGAFLALAFVASSIIADRIKCVKPSDLDSSHTMKGGDSKLLAVKHFDRRNNQYA